MGNADGVVGSLYNGSSDTPGSVYSAFAAHVSGSPLVSAATGFFTVNVGGSCPVWRIPGSMFWGAGGLDFSFFCDPGVLAILALGGWIVLAMGAFSAFRIALY